MPGQRPAARPVRVRRRSRRPPDRRRSPPRRSRHGASRHRWKGNKARRITRRGRWTECRRALGRSAESAADANPVACAPGLRRMRLRPEQLVRGRGAGHRRRAQGRPMRTHQLTLPSFEPRRSSARRVLDSCRTESDDSARICTSPTRRSYLDTCSSSAQIKSPVRRCRKARLMGSVRGRNSPPTILRFRRPAGLLNRSSGSIRHWARSPAAAVFARMPVDTRRYRSR